MKKLIYISLAALTFSTSTQGIAIAQDGQGMDEQDFTQLVCSYLEEYDEKREAITEVLSATRSLLDSSQRQTLKNLVKEELSAEVFCSDIEL